MGYAKTIYTILNPGNKNGLMKIYSKVFCLLVILNLGPYLTPFSLAANGIKKPIQGPIQKKDKSKLNKVLNKKAANPYSISQPYNPNNPPPIGNKIDPVSSNAH